MSTSDEPPTSTACIPFSIDTATILENRNLDALIASLDAANFTSHTKFESMPGVIKTFLGSLDENKFLIANPGEDWQATDVVLGKRLPNRRLLYLGVGQDIALLAYYKGGIGKSERILIFRFTERCVIDFWCGGVLTNLKTKEQIVEYLKGNKNKHWGLNTNVIYI
ncbi:hypothetical protein KK062_25820 [Fulvivirgaceae bacterium PWU5]|uniref:Uncharacterized protein n=1 Tax=Dawidia cretensis TaxID=2782350 RepID=A0AAP2GWX7_9BACT|nr:hypothetical protein [Dawidia cretensis]MBT1711687.1 hypothetical protein [Dawidia cretensis]